MDPRLIRLIVALVATAMLYVSSVVPDHADMLIAAAAGMLGWVGLRRPGDEKTRPRPKLVE